MEEIHTIDDLGSVSLGVSDPSGDSKVDLGRLCNALSLLHLVLGEKSWVGLYLVHDGQLILGPFQGTPACEVIAFGKGVVGTCYSQGKPIAIDDVNQIENYICCDATAKSEICLPVWREKKIIAILDIDLPQVHHYSDEEIQIYQGIAEKLQPLIH